MTRLATAALDVDALLVRVELRRAEIPGNRTDEARRNRPCMICGDRPSSQFLRGPLCPVCAPAQPVGYCAPARCYCAGDSCQRPA